MPRKTPGTKRRTETPPARGAIAKPEDNRQRARVVHGRGVPSAVYGRALELVLGEGGAPDARMYAADAIAAMAPRDPAEEMLIAQMLFAHSRVVRLSALANQQQTPEGVRIINEYADRASNTYRRLMLALRDYREPRRSGDSFTAIKQANFANQQLVQNHEKEIASATNEQGCRQPVHGSPALPANAAGAGVVEGVSPSSAAVAQVHGTKDG